MEAPREKKKKKRGGDNITWSNIHVIKISEGEEWEEKNIWRNKGWKFSKLIKKKKSTYKYKRQQILHQKKKKFKEYHVYAAKSLQSCPTLCDPIDGSPLGSSVPGILQARILEWVAISFSNAWKWKVKMKSFSRPRLLATPRTAAYQAPPSMGFSRQEYWSGVPLPSPPCLCTSLKLLKSKDKREDYKSSEKKVRKEEQENQKS